MSELAELIQAVASLLWPLLAFLALFFFRRQIKEVLIQLSRTKKLKIGGSEIELIETFEHDETSKILNDYLFPNGIYNDERRQKLNALLHELGIMRDVSLILDGAEGAALRRQLIKYAQEKGFGLAGDSTDPSSPTG